MSVYKALLPNITLRIDSGRMMRRYLNVSYTTKQLQREIYKKENLNLFKMYEIVTGGQNCAGVEW